ncbi:MAG: putative Ig domain-containing protein, partial [Candidatus Thalassarchaeaceae archaeon]|nr:putative Ig domain-containing protein [Candidatus Thalassarchaeaceae archaeon]
MILTSSAVPLLMSEGNPSLAIAIAALFLALSMGGAVFYITTTLPIDTPPIDEDDETIIEPEKPEPPIECAIDEREVLDDDVLSVIGCEKIIAPHNVTFEQQSITLTRGNIVIINWTIEGDYTVPILHPCNDSSASIQPIIKPIMNSLKVIANDIGYATCVIEFSNPAGTLNYTISVEVIDLPPSNLEYQHPVYILTKGEPFTTFPNYDDGEPTQWESDPELPQGLLLREDGAIIGSPTILIPATIYTITASNKGGFDNTNITLIIHDKSPNSVNYLDSELILTIGEQMNGVLPSHSGGDIVQWEIDPELPLGLSFSITTGRISGTPLTLHERTEHIVYANNSGGIGVTLITITVKDNPVNSIDYGVIEMDLVVEVSSVNVTPNTSGGMPVVWEIEPYLPHGLEFDGLSGRIWGIGDAITPWTNHTIWANNSGGPYSS